MTPFLQHTSWLCLSFGLLFSFVNPRIDALFGTPFSTTEALAMVRHFGVAMVFLGLVCHSLRDDPPAAFVSLLVAWHAAVMGCWCVELGAIGVFRNCPLHTRVSVYSGVAAQLVLLCEGLLEVGPETRMRIAFAAAIAAAITSTSLGKPRADKRI